MTVTVTSDQQQMTSHFSTINQSINNLYGDNIPKVTVISALKADLGQNPLHQSPRMRISGGALSVVVIAERRYGPCWLSDDNKQVSP